MYELGLLDLQIQEVYSAAKTVLFTVFILTATFFIGRSLKR